MRSAAQLTRPSPYIDLMDPRSSAVYLRPTPSLSHDHRARRNARRRVLSCRVMKWGARVASRGTGEKCAQSKFNTGQLSGFLRPSAWTPCAAQDVRACWSFSLAPPTVLVSSTGGWTSDAIKCERERNSKIRARHDTRRELLYTLHVDGARESRVREQEVVHQKPRQRTRPGPVKP